MLQDLNCLIERYLEPLKEETFLTGDDIQQLFGNIREIVQFQRLFLQSLEDAVIIDPDLNIVDNPKHFSVSSLVALDPGAKTIEKNTNSTPNKYQIQRARAYKVT